MAGEVEDASGKDKHRGDRATEISVRELEDFAQDLLLPPISTASTSAGVEGGESESDEGSYLYDESTIEEYLAEVFLEAAREGNIQALQNMLGSGLSPNVVDGDYNTALQIAAAEGNVPMMEVLLDNGAQVDQCNELGFTPLLHACCNGKAEAVKFLLAHGADPSRKTFYGTNALTLATFAGSLEIAALIHGFCNALERNAPSPLMVAVWKRNFDFIALYKLLRGSPLWYQFNDFFGLSARSLARSRGDSQISEFLDDLDDLVEGKADCWSIGSDVRCLIHEGKVCQLQQLLDSDRGNLFIPKGTTPLMFAAIVGNLRMVECLIDRGFEVNHSIEGFSALTLAIACGNDDVVRYLLRKGAKVDADNLQRTVDLASHSSGIRSSTVDLLVTGHGKSRKRIASWSSKILKRFRRKKIEGLRTDMISTSGSVGRAFHKRVLNSLGCQVSMLPLRLFQLFTCPHDDAELSALHCLGFEQPIASKARPVRIIDSYSQEDIENLISEFYHGDYAQHYYNPTSSASLNNIHLQEQFCGVSSPSGYNQLRPCYGVNRSISEVRSSIFRFNTISDHGACTERSSMNAAQNRDLDDFNFLEYIKQECGTEASRMLENQQMDLKSFLLLKGSDFEETGFEHHQVEVLEEIQKELGRNHVVYL